MSDKKIKLYSIDEAINFDTNKKNTFIISHERLKKDGSIGRIFYIFPSFKKFIENRDDYPYSHEILLDHKNSNPDPRGRLVFDFDLPNKEIVPKKFTEQVNEIIIETIDQYFENVDLDIIEFVWSSTEYDVKFSKHLTVKNFYLDEWINMTKLFYDLFLNIWNNKYDWIDPALLIDKQIARKHASLRMVGSSKINGKKLTLDDRNFRFEDSLIRIYDDSQEQLITLDNLKYGVLENVISDKKSNKIKNKSKEKEITDNDIIQFDEKIYFKAFKIACKIFPEIFSIGKISNRYMTLLRLKSFYCPISQYIHDKENAFLVLNESTKIIKDKEVNVIYINYGCFRDCCNNVKTKKIGHILKDRTYTNKYLIQEIITNSKYAKRRESEM